MQRLSKLCLQKLCLAQNVVSKNSFSPVSVRFTPNQPRIDRFRPARVAAFAVDKRLPNEEARPPTLDAARPVRWISFSNCGNCSLAHSPAMPFILSPTQSVDREIALSPDQFILLDLGVVRTQKHVNFTSAPPENPSHPSRDSREPPYMTSARCKPLPGLMRRTATVPIISARYASVR